MGWRGREGVAGVGCAGGTVVDLGESYWGFPAAAGGMRCWQCWEAFCFLLKARRQRKPPLGLAAVVIAERRGLQF